MKILVLSDSHSAISFMRYALSRLQPDAIIHLGDHYDDGLVLASENPAIAVHQVPGNCDRYRCDPTLPQWMCYDIGGVRIYMTHGHLHGVKTSRGRLLADARQHNARAVLYGHTHEADCHCEEDGLWVLNPGACGSYGGSVGLIETGEGEILSCRILRGEELMQ